jgi:hypothetical protein
VYESSIVRRSVLNECGIYVFVCQIARKFAFIQDRLNSSGKGLEVLERQLVSKTFQEMLRRITAKVRMSVVA